MLRLVDDLLDISKVEAGLIEWATEPFCVRQVLDDVVSLFAATKG